MIFRNLLNKTQIIAALLVAIVFLILMFVKSCNDVTMTKRTNKELSDTLYKYKDRDGRNAAQISVLTGDLEQIKAASKNDTTLTWMLSIISENKKLKSALVATNRTNFSGVGKTSVISKDTVRKDSLIYLYPEYYHNYSDRWINYTVIQNKDTSRLELEILDDFEITNKLVRKSIFHPYSMRLEWKNNNPHSQILDMRQYSKDEKLPNNKNGIGISVGYGINLNGQISPYIGIGYSRNIITF